MARSVWDRIQYGHAATIGYFFWEDPLRQHHTADAADIYWDCLYMAGQKYQKSITGALLDSIPRNNAAVYIGTDEDSLSMFGNSSSHLQYLELRGHPVHVGVRHFTRLPAFNVVGLPDTAVQEARERVRKRMRHSRKFVSTNENTINLAPADLRKYGTGF